MAHDEDLERFLLDEADYSSEYTVQTQDPSEVEETGGTGGFDDVEPAECARVMDQDPYQIPEEYLAAAAQTAEPPQDDHPDLPFYTEIVMDGVAGGAGDIDDFARDIAAPMEEIITECSSFTATSTEDGADFDIEGGWERIDLIGDPPDAIGFTTATDMQGSDGVNSVDMGMTMHVAMGQVGEYTWVLIGMQIGVDGEDVPDRADEAAEQAEKLRSNLL